MKFLSPGVVLYLYKSTIQPCMKYCCNVWAGALSCYLELLDKLQKQTCMAVGPSLAASLEPYTQLHDCSVTIPICNKDVSMSTVSFLAQLDSRIFCQQNAFL